jgi:hypothetical protein
MSAKIKYQGGTVNSGENKIDFSDKKNYNFRMLFIFLS